MGRWRTGCFGRRRTQPRSRTRRTETRTGRPHRPRSSSSLRGAARPSPARTRSGQSRRRRLSPGPVHPGTRTHLPVHPVNPSASPWEPGRGCSAAAAASAEPRRASHWAPAPHPARSGARTRAPAPARGSACAVPRPAA